MGNFNRKDDSLREFFRIVLLHSVYGDSGVTHLANFLAFLSAVISQDFKGGDN